MKIDKLLGIDRLTLANQKDLISRVSAAFGGRKNYRVFNHLKDLCEKKPCVKNIYLYIKILSYPAQINVTQDDPFLEIFSSHQISGLRYVLGIEATEDINKYYTEYLNFMSHNREATRSSWILNLKKLRSEVV